MRLLALADLADDARRGLLGGGGAGRGVGVLGLDGAGLALERADAVVPDDGVGGAAGAVAGGLGHVGVLSGRCCRVPWPGRLTNEAMLLLHKLHGTSSMIKYRVACGTTCSVC